MKKNIIYLWSLFFMIAFTQAVLAADGLANKLINASNYTIQLVSLDTLKEANSYIARNRLKDIAVPVEVVKNGKHLYKVVYGDYASNSQAQTALNQLPANLKQAQPWVRHFKDFVH